MTAITTDPASLRSAERRTRGSRLTRLLRGPGGDPSWVRPAVLALLAVTAALYMIGLSANGWANDFYAAAVQAGATSWKAFFFGSFDSSGFITVDKTPAFLWVMELSARIFGLNYWSVLLPQALEGVAAVGLLYATVRRWSGPAAGILAGAVMALTPVATLMFRFNNPDSLLVLLMTAAAYAVTRAIENGRTRWLVLAGALIGFGFLTKMMQAFLVIPGFALAYLVAGPAGLGRRVWQLLAAGAAVVAGAGWWVAAVMLTPAADRPYVGGSTSNSILQLAFGYNGFGRLTGNETGSVGGGGGGQGGRWGVTGLTRMFGSEVGAQVSWLLPAALIALAAILVVTWRAPRIDRPRASALLWGGWLLVTGVTFSLMAGIFHQYYTVALTPAIGALVGIGGVGLWQMRRRLAARLTLAAGLAVTVIWSYVLLNRDPSWYPWLRWLVALTGAAGVAALLAGPRLAATASTARGRLALAAIPVPLLIVAGLSGPAAYSAETAATAHSGAIPTAGPAGSSMGGFGGGGPGGAGGARGLGGRGTGGTGTGGTGTAGGGFGGTGGQPGGAGTGGAGAGGQAGGTGTGTGGTGSQGVPQGVAGVPGGTGGRSANGGGVPGGLGGSTQVSSALTTLLKNGAAGYRWAAATVGAESAAPYQLASGEPIMAIGGFNGTDQAPTLAQFEKLVAAHEIHYFIGSGRGGFGGGSSGTSSQIAAWVASHFTSQTVGGQTIYDLTK